MKIIMSDVTWKKIKLIHIDKEGHEFPSDTKCVKGTIDNDVEIGHYLTSSKENEVCCVVSFDEENGGNIFINRTYVFDDPSMINDDFFREKIVEAYNKIVANESNIKSIFD